MERAPSLLRLSARPALLAFLCLWPVSLSTSASRGSKLYGLQLRGVGMTRGAVDAVRFAGEKPSSTNTWSEMGMGASCAGSQARTARCRCLGRTSRRKRALSRSRSRTRGMGPCMQSRCVASRAALNKPCPPLHSPKPNHVENFLGVVSPPVIALCLPACCVRVSDHARLPRKHAAPAFGWIELEGF
jgi:hypothetical protein